MRSVTSPPFRIFLSYRREDSQDAAGRLYDLLAVTFGEDNVFIDVDAIPAGVDFVDQINEAVARADVFVALIGKRWLGDESGGRPLDDEDDFVRLELEAALGRGIPVIPALVQSAQPPTASDLPMSLTKLARIQGQTLSHERWNYDSGQLVSRLKEIESQRAPPPPPIPTPPRSPRRRSLLNRFSRNRILILGGMAVVAVSSTVAALVVMTDGGSPAIRDDQTTTHGGQTTTTPLFEDDFSSQEYGWPDVAEGQVGGRYSNGSYQILARGPERLLVDVAPASAPTAENVRIDVEARRTGGSATSHYGYGIVCRATDDFHDLYRFTLWPNSVFINKRLDDESTLLTQKRVETGGVVKEMQAQCVTKPGGAVELDFVVNGMRIHARDDEEPLRTGAFGLHAVLGHQAGAEVTLEARFDNFAVSQVEARRR